MYYYIAVVKMKPATVETLANEKPELLEMARNRVYVGRTRNPHFRATQWQLDASNSLGRTLQQINAMGFLRYRDYYTLCHVSFCIVGPKNTPEHTWDAIEAAYKLLISRTPNKLHSQSIEYYKGKFKDRERTSIYSDQFESYKRQDLEAEADRLLSSVFLGI